MIGVSPDAGRILREAVVTRPLAWIVCGALAVTSPTTGWAQGIEVTPLLGVHIPTRPSVLVGGLPVQLAPHTLFSLQVTRPLSSRAAVEIVGAVGQGAHQGVDGTVYDFESRVFIVDLRARWQIARVRVASLSLIGGGGWMRYRGTYLDLVAANPDVEVAAGVLGASVGAGARAQWGNGPIVALEVVDRIHRNEFNALPATPDLKQFIQHDLGLSVGVTLLFGSSAAEGRRSMMRAIVGASPLK